MNDFSVRLSAYLATPGPHKLELGAGENVKPGWFATDLFESKNANGTITSKLDVREPFQLSDSSFDYIYSEHMIEHLSFVHGQKLLHECHRTLKPGGVLRIVTPHIGFLLRIMSPDRSALEQKYLEWSIRQFVPEAPGISNAFFLNNFMRAWGHLFIYDRATLIHALISSGFKIIKECGIEKSEHHSLQNLENTVRMPAGFLELESMIFEATKQ